MAYVISCGDEGVQINEGTRIAVVGSGFRLEGISNVITAIKKVLGDDLRIASNEESDWIKVKLDLVNWDQVNAMSQQHIQAFADREGLLYAGYLPFADPKQLEHDIKGHMVRPHKVHIANKICFTLGGGEQKYNLGRFVISADWVHVAKPDLIKKAIQPQIEFYSNLVGGQELPFVIEMEGALGEEIANKNKAALESALGVALEV